MPIGEECNLLRKQPLVMKTRIKKHISFVILSCTPYFLLLFVGFTVFSSTGRDDAHITYWASYSLQEFGQILNYNGERIEQSSSPLHVFTLSILGILSGIRVEALGRPLSIFFGCSSLFLTYKLTSMACDNVKTDNVAKFLSTLLTGISAYFVYWSFGGLESTLAAFAILGLIIVYGKYLSSSHVIPSPYLLTLLLLSTGGLLLVRPEMPIVILFLLAGHLSFFGFFQKIRGNTIREVLSKSLNHHLFLLVVVAFWALPIFAIRKIYFNSFFPQPVLAKSAGFSSDIVSMGLDYYEQSFYAPGVFAASIFVLYVLSLIYVFLMQFRELNIYISLSFVFTVIYASFALFSGGDWMEGGRFFVPIIPLLSLFLSTTISSFRNNLRFFIGLLVITLSLSFIFQFAQKYSTGLPIWDSIVLSNEYGFSRYTWFERRNRVNLRDMPAVSYLEKLVEKVTVFKQGPVTIFTAQMGIVPYYMSKNYYGQIYWYDMFSLADNTFMQCPIASDLPRLPSGMFISYAEYFDQKERFRELCGISEPDLIYDLTREKAEITEANGYTVVFLQTGEVSGHSLFLQSAVPAYEFVAIRNDLLRLVDVDKIVILYDEISYSISR